MSSETILIRNIPGEVKEALLNSARNHSRSMNAEALVALKRGLGSDESEQRALMREIEQYAPELSRGADSASLIRKDRDNR